MKFLWKRKTVSQSDRQSAKTGEKAAPLEARVSWDCEESTVAPIRSHRESEVKLVRKAFPGLQGTKKEG